MKCWYAIWFFLLPFWASQINGQYTAIKNVEKSFTVAPGHILKMAVKKSDVRLVAWNRKDVQIKMRIESISTQKEMAERDLDYVQYSIMQENQYLILNNNFLIPEKGKKIGSEFRIFWTLYVPSTLSVILTSTHGLVEMSGMHYFVNCYSEHGKVIINDALGKQNFYTFHSDFDMRSSKGDFKMNVQEGTYKIDQVSGNLNLDTKMAKGEFRIKDELSLIQIKSEGGNLVLYASGWDRINYNLNLSKVQLEGESFLNKYNGKFKHERKENKVGLSLTIHNSNLKIKTNEY